MSDSFPNDRFDGAPTPKRPKKGGRPLFVPLILFGGLATTLGTLFAIFVIAMVTNFPLLSFVINFVIPLGAIGAGLVAGSGYAVTARLLQYRPSTLFIVFICLLQFGLFFVGRYIEYVPHRIVSGGETTFAEHYRYMIEESEWSSQRSKEPFKMGKKGWLLEFATALCFSLTSLVWVGVLSASSYCGDCRRFMSKGLEFVFPARAPKRKIKKKDLDALAEFQRSDDDAFDRAMDRVREIIAFLESDAAKDRAAVYGFLCELRDEIGPHPSKVKNVTNTVRVLLSGCSECGNFQVVTSLTANDPTDKTAKKPIEYVNFIDGEFVVKNVP